MISPATSERNLTPSSTAPGSLSIGGTTESDQIEQGQLAGTTSTTIPGPGVSRLPLSSAARVLIVAWPVALGVQA